MKEVKLKRCDTISIDQQILEVMEEDAEVLNIQGDMTELRQKVMDGDSGEIFNPESSTNIYYEIYYDNERVGVIILSLSQEDDDKLWEITMIIIKAQQKKGIGRKAIKKLLDLEEGKSLLVAISTKHKAKNGLIQIFIDNGFVQKPHLEIESWINLSRDLPLIA